MTIEQFDELRKTLAAHRNTIVLMKRPEYTEGNSDVLHNFKIVAEELRITPIQVWYVCFRKHVASIGQLAAGNAKMSEPIIDRIADAMNYLDLLLALAKDSYPPIE